MVFIDSFLQKNISVLSKCSAVIGVPDHRALRKNGAFGSWTLVRARAQDRLSLMRQQTF
jgi:hypothetical protein